MNNLTRTMSDSLEFHRWFFYIIDQKDSPEKIANEVYKWLKENKFTGWK